MLTKEDLATITKKNITKEEIEEQLNYFKTGFPFIEIISASSAQRGIMKIGDEISFLNRWQDYLQSDAKVTKFVPASGAASRMFKDLFAFLDAEYDIPTNNFEINFFTNIDRFAFYSILDTKCKELFDKDIATLIVDGEYKSVVKALLDKEGLNYGNLPKGLLQFHKYGDKTRTPFEEHLKEGSIYAKDKNNKVNIHFTVSGEHIPLFESLLNETNKETNSNTKFEVSFSIQKSSTDTISVDRENNLFRNDDGSLLFRPGGHGSLIENLNDINADIIFIKNIDNVVPDRLKEDEAKYKKLIAGVLIDLQKRAFEYLQEINDGSAKRERLYEILDFTINELCTLPASEFKSDNELKKYLTTKLNRPFRVCGMVKNMGEPGGGPFIAKNPDGTASLQILESTQIDKSDKRAANAFENGSYFNPVDLVCGVKDYKGNKFDLTKYVDKNSGFISQKSKNGKELKALERPGLWNGAMSDWNTIFVELPISTFNPVKTVNDLLRNEHQ